MSQWSSYFYLEILSGSDLERNVLILLWQEGLCLYAIIGGHLFINKYAFSLRLNHNLDVMNPLWIYVNDVIFWQGDSLCRWTEAAWFWLWTCDPTRHQSEQMLWGDLFRWFWDKSWSDQEMDQLVTRSVRLVPFLQTLRWTRKVSSMRS